MTTISKRYKSPFKIGMFDTPQCQGGSLANISMQISLGVTLVRGEREERGSWDWLTGAGSLVRCEECRACHKNSHWLMWLLGHGVSNSYVWRDHNNRDGHTLLTRQLQMGMADKIVYLTVFKYFQLFSLTDKVSHYTSCNKVTTSSWKLFYIYLTTFWLNLPQQRQQTLTPEQRGEEKIHCHHLIALSVPGVCWCRAPDQLGCFMMAGGGWCRVWDGSRWSSTIITSCHPATRYWDVIQCAVMIPVQIFRSAKIPKYRDPSLMKMPQESTSHQRSRSESQHQSNHPHTCYC